MNAVLHYFVIALMLFQFCFSIKVKIQLNMDEEIGKNHPELNVQQIKKLVEKKLGQKFRESGCPTTTTTDDVTTTRHVSSITSRGTLADTTPTSTADVTTTHYISPITSRGTSSDTTPTSTADVTTTHYVSLITSRGTSADTTPTSTADVTTTHYVSLITSRSTSADTTPTSTADVTTTHYVSPITSRGTSADTSTLTTSYLTTSDHTTKESSNFCADAHDCETPFGYNSSIFSWNSKCFCVITVQIPLPVNVQYPNYKNALMFCPNSTHPGNIYSIDHQKVVIENLGMLPVWLGMTYNTTANVTSLYNGTVVSHDTIKWRQEFPKGKKASQLWTQLTLYPKSSDDSGVANQDPDSASTGILCEFN